MRKLEAADSCGDRGVASCPTPPQGLLACLLFFLASPAFAQAPPEVHASAPTSVAVTIYRDNLALITETRAVDLPGGPARVVFDGVLDRVIPQSAVVRGLDHERERNFDFDGLNPMSLLWRSIGSVVHVVRTNPGNGAVTEEDATVQAAGNGVALRFGDRFEALGCSGLPEKLVFARIPDGLRERPALSTTLADAPAGTREVTLSYLATGIEWQTDYVVTLDDTGAAGDVKAWITLTNVGEEGFRDARVGVVAGDLSRTWTDDTQRAVQRYAQRACWPMGTTSDFPQPPPPPPPPPPMAAPAPAPMMERAAMAKDAEEIVVTGARIPAREELADYQLYTLAERTSVAAQQTKQVMFLHKDAVRFDRVLRYEAGDNDDPDAAEPTAILLRAKNEDARGLGDPLPRGVARVFAPTRIAARDLGTLYAGEADTRDTAVGVEWELHTGESYDVTVRETVVSETERNLSGDRTRVIQDRSLDIANATDRPQTVEIAQVGSGRSLRVSNESARHAMKYGLPTWTLVLAPHARTTLTWRVSYIDG